MEDSIALRAACEDPNGDHLCGYDPQSALCNCICHAPGARFEDGILKVELQPVTDEAKIQKIKALLDTLRR